MHHPSVSTKLASVYFIPDMNTCYDIESEEFMESNVCIDLLQSPIRRHTGLAHGKTPYITRPNASLNITVSTVCENSDTMLPVCLVVEVQVHAHKVAVPQISQDHQSGINGLTLHRAS